MPDAIIETIEKWVDRECGCACGRSHRVLTRTVRFDDQAGSVLREVVGGLATAGPVLVVSDRNTHAASAGALASALRRGSFPVAEHVFSAGDAGPLIADEDSVAQLATAAAAAGPACMVGVGSGTINDLCKTVATADRIPYVVSPTAASMNGYTSTIASLKRGGLKVTEPVRAADGVVVDLEVIGRSPAVMTAAGVADLLSKFVCAADWALARIVEDGYYCEEPARLASIATAGVAGSVDQIAAGEGAGLHTLMAGLILSGISMAVAGSSSPASGGEHLISHYWDMCVPVSGSMRLHGLQVGLGTLMCAALYERLRGLDPVTIDPERVARSVPDAEAMERGIRAHFGSAAPAVIEQFRRKRTDPESIRARCSLIKRDWARIWASLDPILRPAAEIGALLSRAGAATTLSELGLDRESALQALRWARHIRARYTVFDLAADIGVFDAGLHDRLLVDSGVAASR